MSGFGRALQQLTAHVDGPDDHCRVRILRAGVKRQSVYIDAQLGGETVEIRNRFRIAAKLARQVDLRVGAAEGNADQHRATAAKLSEFTQLVWIVDDEAGHAKAQSCAYVAVTLDRMAVNAAFGSYP